MPIIVPQLRKAFGPRITAKFPPRKLLSLTPVQVEERREQLEKYLQEVCQDHAITLSSLFTGFFLNAQKVCFKFIMNMQGKEGGELAISLDMSADYFFNSPLDNTQIFAAC